MINLQQIGDSCARTCRVSEDKIIQRILAGETDLYGILAARHSRQIYQYVRRIVRNATDAEDIVQEAHLRALQYLHRFRGNCKFATWLYHVATNLAFRQLQRRQRSEQLFDGIAGWGRHSRPLTVSIPDPESRVRKREARELLRRAFAKLPQQYQTIFLMKEVKHIETPDIARLLRIRRDNVRLRLHRARCMLRRTIDNDCQANKSTAMDFPGEYLRSTRDQ